LELKGNLNNFAVPDIIQLIGTTTRSGVLVITIGPEKSSIYFEKGHLVHVTHRSLAGQEAVNRIVKEREGSFQFLSGVPAPEKSMSLDWMNALMEAARQDDENRKGLGDEDLDLDLEAAMTGSGPGSSPGQEGQQVDSWDPVPVKARMKEILEENFGKKAKKIVNELKKDPGTKLSLLEFCEKAEKYIYVFIDNKRAEDIANRLRSAMEESVL
jgi:hypothetical protein